MVLIKNYFVELLFAWFQGYALKKISIIIIFLDYRDEYLQKNVLFISYFKILYIIQVCHLFSYISINNITFFTILINLILFNLT